MNERPVYLRLTAEQVESIVRLARGDTMESLTALLSAGLVRGGVPSVDVWEEWAEGEMGESRFSFSLVRGLLLLADLADGHRASLTDLAADLNLCESTAGRYLQTLVMAELVEQDPKTSLYRLAG
jgi:predicted transcriptional regulator